MKQNTKIFDLKRNQFLEICHSETLKFLSPMLNLQSYWRPTSRNFGAPKNMGGLCFQVLGSLGVLWVFVFKTPPRSKEINSYSSTNRFPLSTLRFKTRHILLFEILHCFITISEHTTSLPCDGISFAISHSSWLANTR